MKRITKIGLSVAGLALLAAGGLYVLKSRQEARALAESGDRPAVVAAAPPRFEGLEFAPADLATVQTASLRRAVRLSGTLQPLDQSQVRAEVAATVEDVMVRRGERVQKGQLLAKLDTADLGARLREKQSNLDSARSALNLAAINREKAATLAKSGYKSQTALDEAENTWRTARANVAAMEQQVTMAKKALNDAAIYAPLGGLIGDRFVNPGERVAVDAKLFTIADLDTMEVEALVPARDVPQLKVGQRVILHVEGFGDREFDAQIARINPTAQSGTRSIPVFVLLRNPDLVLRGGMFGTGEAVLAEIDNALAVPADAVRREKDETVVYVLAGDKLERRKVTVLLDGTTDGRVALGGDIKAGETVIATPGLRLNDGLPARISGR